MTIFQPSSVYPFYPENGDSMSLRNSICIPNYLVSHSGSCVYGSHLEEFKSHKKHGSVGAMKIAPCLLGHAWKRLQNVTRSVVNVVIILQYLVQVNVLSYCLLAGYASIYKQRTGNNVDGIAIYYKRDVFELVDHTTVEYFQPGVSVLDRHNVGLVAKLAVRANPSRYLVVATTHLLYNPRRHDVKLAQMQVLLAEVERFAFKGFR